MSATIANRWIGLATLAAVLLLTGSRMVCAEDEINELNRARIALSKLIANTGREGNDAGYWIGVSCRPVSDEVRTKLNLAAGQGLIVDQVLPNSPAEKAGLGVGDVILQAGETPVGQVAQLAQAVADSGGAALSLQLVHDGQKKTITITPAKRSEAGRIIVIREDDEDGDDDDDDKPMPRNEGEAAQAKAIERLQTLQKKLREELARLQHEPGRRGIVYRPQPGQPGSLLPEGAQPGAGGFGIAAAPSLPEDMQVTIQKRGNKPARVIAVQGEKTWQTTENELDMLPAAARVFASRALGKPAWPAVGSAGAPLNRFDVRLGEGPTIQVQEQNANPGAVVNRVPGGVQIQIVEGQNPPKPQGLEPALKPGTPWQELKRPEAPAAPDPKRQLHELREQTEQLLREVKEFQERRRAAPTENEKSGDNAPAPVPGALVPAQVAGGIVAKAPQSLAAHYIENTGKVVGLSAEQKESITKIFEARERQAKEFDAKHAEQIKAATEALSAAFQSKDKDAIGNATKVRQELYAPIQEAWRKSQADLMNVLTAEQRTKLHEHQLTSSVKAMTAPVSLTDEQWQRIRAAFKEGYEANWEKFPQLFQEVLTTEQKSAIAKHRLMDAVKMSFRGSNLTADQLQAIESTCDELVSGYSKLGLDPAMWPKVAEKVNGLLTNEQKENLKKTRSEAWQLRGAGGWRVNEAIEKE